MSGSEGQLWPDNPNAPKITYGLYFREKANFAGFLIGSILYGIIIVLFFRCMGALLNPVRRRGEGIKWVLVSHTVAMFSVVTVGTAMNLEILSVSYIDDREFPDIEGFVPPGPLGYRWIVTSTALGIIPDTMLFLNNWLADGLLLYRCYVIYSRNFWAITFPCLMYLGSVVMGAAYICQTSRPNDRIWNTVAANFGLPYFSISIALNILLTLMIVIRVVLYMRFIRTAKGSAGLDGLYKGIVTVLIESSALYAVNSLLFVGPWGAGNHASDIFLPILAQTQVIAPMLIIQRVANKSALTGNDVVHGSISEFKAKSRGESADGGSFPGGDSMTGSTGECGKDPGELEVRADVETTIDFH